MAGFRTGTFWGRAKAGQRLSCFVKTSERNLPISLQGKIPLPSECAMDVSSSPVSRPSSQVQRHGPIFSGTSASNTKHATAWRKSSMTAQGLRSFCTAWQTPRCRLLSATAKDGLTSLALQISPRPRRPYSLPNRCLFAMWITTYVQQ